MRKLSSIGFGILGAAMLGGTFGLRAQSAPQPPSQAPVIEIVDCVVYPEGEPSRTVDCAAKARPVCNGAASCELPIGLALTDGQQIDHDARTWKKVRVRYRCEKVEHINGPHNQDDHATMLLGCRGGF
jgi:hypothetical protein